MPGVLRKRWVWITALFAVINVAGLWAIVAAVRGRTNGLGVEAFRPEGVASTQAAISVRFDQPMVARAEIGSPVAAELLDLFPPVPGRAVWQDTRTAAFEPQEELRLATPYTVTASRRFTSLLGHSLGRDRVFEFHTPRLDLVNVRQTGRSPNAEVCLTLAFNDKVRPDAVDRHLIVRSKAHTTVQRSIGGRVPSHEVRVTTRPYRAEWLTVHLARGLQGVSGPLGLADDRVVRVKIEAGLKVTHLEARANAPDDVSIRVNCTQRVDLRTAAKFIRAEPAVDFKVASAYSGLRLRGPFAPGKRYRLTFLEGLCSIEGSSLEKDTTRAVTVPDCPPSLRFGTRGTYLSAGGALLLPLESVNVRKAEVELEQVYANNVVHYLRGLASSRGRWYGARYPADLGHSVVKRTVALDGARNSRHVEKLDLRALLGDAPHGLFLASARDAKNSWTHTRKVIVVTDLGLSVKRSATGLLVWVCALSSASPVPGAEIAVFTRASQRILTGTTDAGGMARFTGLDWSGDRTPYAVAATKGGDTGIVVLDETAVDESDLDTGGRAYLAKGYEAFVYSDRELYRPGSDVVLRAIVRGQALAVPTPFPVQFRLTRPDGRHYKTLAAKLSEWGSAEVTVRVPHYALTGRYAVELRVPGGEGAIGRHTVRVEDFMPDRMKAEVSAEDRRWRAGEELTWTVTAAHLFGSPAAGRAAEARCRFVPATFSHPAWPGFRFADSGKGFVATDAEPQRQTLDANGQATFKLAVPSKLACPSALDAVISVTVKELGGRGVTAGLLRHLDVVPRYVGLAREGERHAAIGRDERILCALVLPDGSPVPTATLEGCVCRIVWHTVLKSDDEGRCRYVSEREEQPLKTLECAIADGRGAVTFKPDDYGQYVVRLRDGEGGASADLHFYCSGRGYVPWAMEKPHRVELVADRQAYAPGDEAVVLVKAPFAGQALLTVESDRVHIARSTAMAANTAEFRFPIDAAFGPNVYCTATVIRKVAPEGKWAAHRAYGAVPIRLDSRPRHLQVEVEAAGETRPGRPLRVALRVRDATGAGRRAEVTLAAVDEGICQLTRYQTPDPWDFFFAKRSLAVTTSDVYSLLMPEIARHRVGSASAAGGDGDEGPDYDPRLFNPVAVERVKQVALWRSGIETDAEGRAEVVLDVPEFTGQLRLMAVAAGTSAFGAAERPAMVKQPLMVRASFPRFVAPGDEFTVPVTVFNHTGSGGSVRLAAESGSGLAFPSGLPESVHVAGGGEHTALLTVRAAGIPGPASLAVTARLGGETATERVELAIRPTTTLRFKAGSGAVPAGTRARIPVPGGWLEGTDKYSLSFSALPTLKLGASLRYLLRYPYGCIEQTTSAAFPLLYLGDVAELVDPESFDRDAIDEFLQAGIDRVLSMQGYNGGFGGWPGYWDVYPWGSVYATHFLAEAKKAGCDVPEDNLDAALDHLEGMLSDDDANRATKAYACYVLAVAGRPNASWTYRLWEERDELTAYSRVHIALALAMKQERQLVADFLRQAKLPAVTARRDTGGVLHSSTREAAMLLAGYLDLNPAHPHVPLLVKRLEAATSQGRWMTTQENAFAVMALGKYARRLRKQEIDLRAEATVDGQPLAAFTHRDRTALQPERLGGKAVEVAVTGKGTLYYYWSAEGIPLTDDAVAKDEGLVVRRRFLSRKGEPLDPARLPHGEVLVVEIAVRAARPVENVVINDLLPAGLEIENPTLATTEQFPMPSIAEVSLPRGKSPAPPSTAHAAPPPERLAEPLHADRVERRDDRLVLFADLHATRTFYHRYLARAVTRGRFRLPAVNAFAMYDPGVCSIHGAGTVEVR